MDPISVILDAFIGGAVAGAGGRNVWDPVKSFGIALTIVAVLTAFAGAWMFADTMHGGREALAFATLLFPFGVTWLAGVAGERGPKAVWAGAFAAALALAGGAPLWVMISVLDVITFH